MESNKYLVDSNVIIYSLFKEYINFNLSDESVLIIDTYEKLKVEDKIVPFFIATESISIITKRFYKLLKRKLPTNQFGEFAALLKLFINTFENNHIVFMPADFLVEESFNAYKSIDYLNSPNLTFTDVSLAIAAKKLGLMLLTCDKNLMQFYKSLN